MKWKQQWHTWATRPFQISALFLRPQGDLPSLKFQRRSFNCVGVMPGTTVLVRPWGKKPWQNEDENRQRSATMIVVLRPSIVVVDVIGNVDGRQAIKTVIDNEGIEIIQFRQQSVSGWFNQLALLVCFSHRGGGDPIIAMLCVLSCWLMMVRAWNDLSRTWCPDVLMYDIFMIPSITLVRFPVWDQHTCCMICCICLPVPYLVPGIYWYCTY